MHMKYMCALSANLLVSQHPSLVHEHVTNSRDNHLLDDYNRDSSRRMRLDRFHKLRLHHPLQESRRALQFSSATGQLNDIRVQSPSFESARQVACGG